MVSGEHSLIYSLALIHIIISSIDTSNFPAQILRKPVHEDNYLRAMPVFLPTAYEMSKYSAPKSLLLSRRLPPSAEQLQTLNIDNSVSD